MMKLNYNCKHCERLDHLSIYFGYFSQQFLFENMKFISFGILKFLDIKFLNHIWINIIQIKGY